MPERIYQKVILCQEKLNIVVIAAKKGLPLEVIHITGAYSLEGDLIKRTPETTLVHYMDFAYAKVVLRAKAGTSLGKRMKFQVIQKRP